MGQGRSDKARYRQEEVWVEVVAEVGWMETVQVQGLVVTVYARNAAQGFLIKREYLVIL
jgi:hypothetical protein